MSLYEYVQTYLPNDGRKLIRKCQYRKLLSNLDSLLFRLVHYPIVVKIQLCRRLLHCVSSILKSYLYNHDDLSTKKISQLFDRAYLYLQILKQHVELAFHYKDMNYLIHVQNEPTIADYYSQRKKLKFYMKEFFFYLGLMSTLQNEYYKRQSLSAQGFIYLAKFNHRLCSTLQLYHHLYVHHIWEGSFYYKMKEYPSAITSYMCSITSVQNVLEKLLSKDITTEREEQILMKEIVCLIIALYCLSLAFETSEQYERIVEAAKLGGWFVRNFLMPYYSTNYYYREVCEIMTLRERKVIKNYQRILDNEKDIRQAIIKLLDIKPVVEIGQQNCDYYDEFLQKIYDKYNFKELNETQMFLRKEVLSYPQPSTPQRPSTANMKKQSQNSIHNNSSTRYQSIATIIPTSTHRTSTEPQSPKSMRSSFNTLISDKYMNMITKNMPSDEFQSRKPQYEQRSKILSQTDKTLSQEIKQALSITSINQSYKELRKGCTMEYPKTKISRVKFVNSIHLRENIISLRLSIEHKQQPKPQPLQSQQTVSQNISEHSDRQTKQEESSPMNRNTDVPEHVKLKKIRQQVDQDSKTIMQEYEFQMDRTQKSQSYFHRSKFVTENNLLAKSVEKMRKKRLLAK